jgi:hypothetical protein
MRLVLKLQTTTRRLKGVGAVVDVSHNNGHTYHTAMHSYLGRYNNCVEYLGYWVTG